MVSRSLGANPDDLKDPIKISIPRYVLCGQGKDAHFEFEVKVSIFLTLLENGDWRLCSAFSVFIFSKGDEAACEYPVCKIFGLALL